MNLAQEAARALQDCEGCLRRLAGKAADASDYDLLSAIANAGKLVSAARAAIESKPVTTADARPPKAPASGSPDPLDSPGYPRFEGRGGELVKIAWSKTDSAEYVHRAPPLLVSSIIKACMNAGLRGALFTSDVVAKATYDAGCSLYQGYVVLAWLRDIGLVQAHGRRGYTLTNPSQFEQMAFAQFNAVMEGSSV